MLYHSQLSRTEVRFGAVSAKSLIIFVEMRSDSLFGNRVEIRTSYSNVENLSGVDLYGLCHLLVSYHPTQSILDVVRLLKQMPTHRIWRQNNNHVHLSKQFWKEKTFWSDGYFACSIGNVSKETIEKYIQSQG